MLAEAARRSGSPRARLRRLCTFSALLACAVANASAASEIAVAIRYFQAKGESHAHIYLFREDGALIRQLTNDDSGQDSNPFFSLDGQEIVFTRTLKIGKEIWSVNPREGNLERLATTPKWYEKALVIPPEPESPAPGASDANSDMYEATDGTAHYRVPGGEEELVVTESQGKDETFWTYTLNNLKTGSHVLLAKDLRSPGVMALPNVKNRFFLIDPPLRLAFVDEHLNSTDGDTVYALDLNTHKAKELSPREGNAEVLDQLGDGPDTFVSMENIQKFEREGKFKEALREYKKMAQSLDAIAAKYPSWKPQILEHRKKLAAEGIARLELKVKDSGEAEVDPDKLGPTQGYVMPFPLPGDGAFLSVTSVRYVPFGDGTKTVNCSYLEQWDSKLHSMRFGQPGASRCYGASIYRPGKQPAALWIAVPAEN